MQIVPMMAIAQNKVQLWNVTTSGLFYALNIKKEQVKESFCTKKIKYDFADEAMIGIYLPKNRQTNAFDVGIIKKDDIIPKVPQSLIMARVTTCVYGFDKSNGDAKQIVIKK